MEIESVGHIHNGINDRETLKSKIAMGSRMTNEDAEIIKKGLLALHEESEEVKKENKRIQLRVENKSKDSITQDLLRKLWIV